MYVSSRKRQLPTMAYRELERTGRTVEVDYRDAWRTAAAVSPSIYHGRPHHAPSSAGFSLNRVPFAIQELLGMTPDERQTVRLPTTPAASRDAVPRSEMGYADRYAHPPSSHVQAPYAVQPWTTPPPPPQRPPIDIRQQLPKFEQSTAAGHLLNQCDSNSSGKPITSVILLNHLNNFESSVCAVQRIWKTWGFVYVCYCYFKLHSTRHEAWSSRSEFCFHRIFTLQRRWMRNFVVLFDLKNVKDLKFQTIFMIFSL